MSCAEILKSQLHFQWKVTQERAFENVEKRKGQKKGKEECVPVLARGMELTEGKDPRVQCAFCDRLWSVN